MGDKYARELNLLEQVHLALGSASKLDDFYIIVASLLVDPNTFGFSRAFFFRYDERTRTFQSKIALGAQSLEEHNQFRKSLMHEATLLKDQIEAIQRESPEPRAVQALYNLRFHSLWIQLVQRRDEGTGLNAAFQDVTLKADLLPENHLIAAAAAGSHARIYDGSDHTTLDNLGPLIQFPVIAGRLVTKRGLHGIIILDRTYQEQPVDEEALYHFQWLLNHASVTLDNVELVEELTAITQRLQEVDRLKTNFLSIVSHELRTPLTSIIGFVHLLVEDKLGQLNGGQRDLLKRVSHHSSHLQSMVNDLLEIAEVEAGGMVRVKPSPVDPLAAFLNILPKIELRRGTKDIKIEPILSETVPQIYADQEALERVLYHLLDNAVKFITHAGSVKVEFVSREENLDVIIADTGIGMKPEDLKRIFDYFYQVDFRLERVYSGMGIGLTVVKMLLDGMGGKIGVESTPGKGTRVTLTFPVVNAGKDSKSDA